ncbi:MAG: YcxB family protein [Akkermansiaceae bacterium]
MIGKYMRIHCQLESADYVSAQFLHLRPRPVFKWLGILLFGLSVLVIVYQVFFVFAVGRGSFPFIPFGAIAYLVLSYCVWLPYKSKKLFKQQKALSVPSDVEITEDYFVSTSSLGSAKLVWADFHKYRIGKDLILVYQNDAIFHMFPKRWFTDGEYQELVEILQVNLGRET